MADWWIDDEYYAGPPEPDTRLFGWSFDGPVNVEVDRNGIVISGQQPRNNLLPNPGAYYLDPTTGEPVGLVQSVDCDMYGRVSVQVMTHGTVMGGHTLRNGDSMSISTTHKISYI